MSFFSKIKSALTKTSVSLSKIGDIFTKKGVSQEALDEFEEILLSADFGINTVNKVLAQVKTVKFTKDDGAEQFKNSLISILNAILEKAQKPLDLKEEGLNIILFCGVNGNGKTTTIGKLANLYKRKGKKVVVAACDTFRSAATEQLNVWAQRAGCHIVTGSHEADAASVAYNALEEAKKTNADVLIIDTAGRLHNQQNLMDELSKILKVIKKVDYFAPHHVILTLDATTGQNAFNQVEKFKEVAGVTGIIFTKLDGTAKGGAIVGVIDKYGLPVHYLSVGESIEDLIEFEAESFAKGLVSI